MAPLSRRWRFRLLVAAGLCALAASYLVVAVPETAPAAVRGPVEALRDPLVGFVRSVGSESLAWLLALVGGAYAVVRLGLGRERPAVAPEFGDPPAERPRAGSPTADDEFDAQLRRATYWIEDPRYGGREVRSRLYRTAVEVVARTGAGSHEAAKQAIATGEWTDDRVAAAFLGDDTAPGLPLRNRFRGWLRPDVAFEHRVERTVAAVHRRLEERG